MLINREVIFTEDVETIFGKRPWTSRTDEILAHKALPESSDAASDASASANDTKAAAEDAQAEDIQTEDAPPPLPENDTE